jgi:hypothetical protein
MYVHVQRKVFHFEDMICHLLKLSSKSHVVYFGTSPPTFRRNVSPSSSMPKSKPSKNSVYRLLLVCFLLDLLLNPEVGGDTLIRNVGRLTQNYTIEIQKILLFTVTAVRTLRSNTDWIYFLRTLSLLRDNTESECHFCPPFRRQGDLQHCPSVVPLYVHHKWILFPDID